MPSRASRGRSCANVGQEGPQMMNDLVVEIERLRAAMGELGKLAGAPDEEILMVDAEFCFVESVREIVRTALENEGRK